MSISTNLRPQDFVSLARKLAGAGPTDEVVFETTNRGHLLRVQVISADRGQRAERNSCNRHDDCAEADKKARARGLACAEHCRDDCCEDCFGS